MKNIVLIGFILLFAAQASAQTNTLIPLRAQAGTSDWKIEKSKHFIIHYQEAPSGYISKVKRYAEHYYKSITDYLGFRRFNFWTWEKRCKIYLYPGRAQYLSTTNVVSWSKGGVHIVSKEIVTYVGKEQFLDYVLPHEMGHIIFREVVGYEKSLPLWMDEAVAILQEKNREKYLQAAKKLVNGGEYIPLKELSQIRSYQGISPDTFYSESASIVDFLLKKFGRNTFVIFCRRLRDGKKWEEALLAIYKFEDLEGLEKAWVNSLLN